MQEPAGQRGRAIPGKRSRSPLRLIGTNPNCQIKSRLLQNAMVDATIVKAIATDRAQRGTDRPGMATKILALTDALGNLVRFVLLPVLRYGGRRPVINDLAFEGFIADKALRQNFLIAILTSAAPRSSSHSIDGPPRLCRYAEIYKWRH